MGQFATLGGDTSIPGTGSSTNEDALGLTNPDAVLTGTSRGQQSLGAPNIKTDSVNQRIIVNDNTTNRVSFGRIGTGVNDWGLKVSKPAFNVDTATADQLIFNSAQNSFKIVSTGFISSPAFNISAPGAGNFSSTSTTSTAVAHGLSYTPAILAFVQVGTTYYSTPYPYYFGGGNSATWASVTAQVDATNVYLYLSGMTAGTSGISFSAGTFAVKYYLLQETAN